MKHTCDILKIKNKRVILSNVCPSIPHQVIEEKLLTFGVRTVVPLTFLRAEFNNLNLSHVLSFRRQTFISPDDEHKLPESFQVFIDDVPHWIYVTPDVPICFLCKNQGHIAKNCPNQCNSQLSNTLPLPAAVGITESTNEIINSNVPPKVFEPTLLESDTVNENSSLNLALDSFPPLPTTPPLASAARNSVASNGNSMEIGLAYNPGRLKSPLSTVSSKTEMVSNQSDSKNELPDSNSETSDMEEKTSETKGKIKKQPSKNKKNAKTSSENVDDQSWSNIKTILDSPTAHYPLNIHQLQSFFDRTLLQLPENSQIILLL